MAIEAIRTAARAVLMLALGAVGLAAAPATAHGAEPSALCTWPRDSADLVNVAFPDASAHYWGSLALGIPGTGIVLRGHYPQARYFSLHTYHATLGASDALSDHEIRPSSGRNPFVEPGQPGAGDPDATGGTWAVRILPGDPPATRPPNTMYTGSTRGVPNLVAIVLYRVYVPDDPDDPQGGVDLPTVAPIVGGRDSDFTLPGCSISSHLPQTQINELIQQTNWPDGLALPTPGASNPPAWKKFFGFGGAIAGAIGADELAPLLDGVLSAGGFLNNLHNDYMSASISRQYGEVVVLRAKMPTFPDTRAGEPPWRRSQLRYWSVCQNHLPTTRYVACLADHQTVLDNRHRATFVISDPDDRPRNATRARGVNWFPWGGIYSSGQLIVRQMLAAPDFRQALAPIEPNQPLAPAMGPYLPKIAYCTTERFERDGPRGCLEQDR